MGLLARAVLILAFIGPGAAVMSPATAAAPRHYDCSKPGNASKAACKGASTSAGSATPARTTTSTVKTTTTTRQYDCTKAGNANKAACRTAAAQTRTGTTAGAVKTTTKTTATTTDCTKWYNRMRAACRTASSSPPPRTTVAPAPRPVPSATRPASASEGNNPAGATAQCRDGTYSHAKTHQGACSHHGGVAKWL
jgi:hypothetical protein